MLPTEGEEKRETLHVSVGLAGFEVPKQEQFYETIS
jgi:hypothetical protein